MIIQNKSLVRVALVTGLLFFWRIRPGPRVAVGFGGNAFFATMFVASALLFRRAGVNHL